MESNKIIRDRFARARNSYDQNALAQRKICDKLFQLLKPHCTTKAKVLELGCGTGNLSKLLSSLDPMEVTLNDLCPNYKEILDSKLEGQEYSFRAVDARELVSELKKSGKSYDLIASSSAIQWLEKPVELLRSSISLLQKGGVMAISSFAEGNISEVTSISGNGLHYPDLEEYKEMVESENCEILHLIREDITINFDSAFEILSHLKQSGVTASSRSRRWTKGDLMAFVGEYNRRFRKADSKCPLTYKPIYLVCKKR